MARGKPAVSCLAHPGNFTFGRKENPRSHSRGSVKHPGGSAWESNPPETAFPASHRI